MPRFPETAGRPSGPGHRGRGCAAPLLIGSTARARPPDIPENRVTKTTAIVSGLYLRDTKAASNACKAPALQVDICDRRNYTRL